MVARDPFEYKINSIDPIGRSIKEEDLDAWIPKDPTFAHVTLGISISVTKWHEQRNAQRSRGAFSKDSAFHMRSVNVTDEHFRENSLSLYSRLHRGQGSCQTAQSLADEVNGRGRHTHRSSVTPFDTAFANVLKNMIFDWRQRQINELDVHTSNCPVE